MSKEIYVTKRDGSKELFSVEKINKVISWSLEGLRNVSLSDVEINVKANIVNNISTKDIHNALTESAVGLITEDKPDYQYVAGNLLNYKLRKDVWGGKTPPKLLDHVKKMVSLKLYSKEMLNAYTSEEWEELEEKIDHDRDFKFTYAGIKQMCDKYLVQNLHTKTIYETPQFAYMCIAAAGFQKYPRETRMKYVKKAYDVFSKWIVSLPTPVLVGMRTDFDSYASCCLVAVDDTLDSIAVSDAVTKIATGRRYGMGLDIGRIRAIGASVDNGRVIHTGVIPFLKCFEASVKSCVQAARGGSATVNIPIWHYEIEDVLQLKNNAQPVDKSVRRLDYCISISKLFYDRFMKDENVTLFSPHEVKGLYDAYGTDKFDELYLKYEANKKLSFRKVVKARELFSLLVKERIETGRIYILNIDHANNHSSWDLHIKQANLCLEICMPCIPLQSFDDPEAEIGVCILGAINMLEAKDEDAIKDGCDIIVRFLEELIDIQNYFNAAAKRFATKKRSLGVGITNMAAWLARNGYKYTDAEACPDVDEWVEKFQYYLLKSSNQLAKERGACEHFSQTKYSRGVLPIDTYKKSVDVITNKRELTMPWEKLREDIVAHGLRHSTVSAMMPCESSSVVSNSTNGLEPIRNRITVKSSKQGRVIQLAPGNKNWKYQTAFSDVNINTGIININAVVQKYTDMAMSTNLYYNPTHYPDNKLPDSVVHKDHLYAYKMGLKTLYYSNTDDGHVSSTSESNDCAGGGCKL